ncbi:helix-turn-helix domain-containing protein [Kribbella speibonae]|uniref:AraC family transcriptional regulator n=1 Tax=Kribbella speibonae TaxID=1572660 RepID=A0A4R0J1L6_9ACTN|nr:helix-turn-helix domain-containing protein [Kribbella speibonae]TCC38036.1 AraC family transcriptional regulator [Kribbella speibonae]
MTGSAHATTGYATRPVHPALRPYVGDVIGYAYDADPPDLHRGLPSRSLTLVVTLDDPLGFAWPGGPVEKYDALVGGLHSTAVQIGQTPSRAGVQLSLTPAAARGLFGLPPGELASAVVGLDDVLGRPARELTEHVRAETKWSARFDVLEDMLLRWLGARRPSAARPELDWAWQRLCASSGAIGVQELATEVGWSRRHLTDRFTSEFGLPPKVASRVLRFERVTSYLRGHPHTRLSDLSAAAGYADQSHLTREFRSIAGCSPRQWMTEELPSLPSNPQVAAIAPASSAGSH